MIVHTFSGYELRPAGLDDLELARAWTNADPDHIGRVDPAFWIHQAPGMESWLLCDGKGPVFFFKAIIHRETLEVHIQFPPYPIQENAGKQIEHRRRVSLALIEGTRWLEQRVKGLEKMRFESQNPSLIRFAEKYLGFTNFGGQLTKSLKEAPYVRLNRRAESDPARTN